MTLKTCNFESKFEIFTKLKKRIPSALVLLSMKIREKHPINVSKNVYRPSLQKKF